MKVAKICEMAGRQAAILVAMGKLGIRELKPKQERVINCLLEGHDAFAALPTGYGKSLLCNATTHILEFLPGLVSYPYGLQYLLQRASKGEPWELLRTLLLIAGC